MALKFRNIDAHPSDPVETWPTEGVMAALERGGLNEWARILVAVERDPWGPVARRLESALEATRPYGVGLLMEQELNAARHRAEAVERQQVADRVQQLIAQSGLGRADFAEAIGTSASRLSTYATGKVVPSAALMVRMERAARRLNSASY